MKSEYDHTDNFTFVLEQPNGIRLVVLNRKENYQFDIFVQCEIVKLALLAHYFFKLMRKPPETSGRN